MLPAVSGDPVAAHREGMGSSWLSEVVLGSIKQLVPPAQKVEKAKGCWLHRASVLHVLRPTTLLSVGRVHLQKLIGSLHLPSCPRGSPPLSLLSPTASLAYSWGTVTPSASMYLNLSVSI